jgi:hypothetical protein
MKGLKDKLQSLHLSTILPIAWNPDPLPPMGSPPILPVTRDPNSIRLVIIRRVIIGGWIVPSVINSRRPHPERRRSRKNPKRAAIVSVPG